VTKLTHDQEAVGEMLQLKPWA